MVALVVAAPVAVLLARRLAEALGRQVSAGDVMRTPTVAALAGAQDGDAARLPPLTRTVDAERLLAAAHPVSWNQSQLLTVHLVDGATAAYNIPMPHWLHGPQRAPAWHAALGAVAERHAVLRPLGTGQRGLNGTQVQRDHL